jgi:hypothetical protein
MVFKTDTAAQTLISVTEVSDMTIFLVTLVLICTVCAMRQKRFASFGRLQAAADSFSFFEEDDSDIKIAGEKPAVTADDTLTDANELEAQRRCGNLERARLLGAELAGKIVSKDGESNFGQDSAESDSTRIQRRLLLSFAFVNTVEEHIKSSVLQGVVLDVFYDKLKEALPGFYDDISESGSFSFYTLCARRGGDVESSVGHTFAMLAGKGGDAVTEELGKSLYLRFIDVALETIKSFDIKQ